MKSLIKNKLVLKKYRIIGLLILIIALVYIASDIIEWYINKDRFFLGFFPMPLYRRLLTYLYILLLGYGGILLISYNSRSWHFIIISMTSIIPSLIIIPLVWNIAFYTNWIVDLPFYLWHVFSLIVIIFFISKRKYFGIKNWSLKLLATIFINVIIRILHEVTMFKISSF